MMTCRRLLAGAPGAAIFLLLASACAHPTQAAQQGMPPRTQDRPLQDRIRSGERPERDSWQKPDEVVQALGLKNGDVVADIGAGTGYFTRPLARAGASDGRASAAGVAADVLGSLQPEADQEGLAHSAA